jgi:hypothetical protein
VAELVDALASGASVPRDVEVQVLSRVPDKKVVFGPLFYFDYVIGVSLHVTCMDKFTSQERNEVEQSFCLGLDGKVYQALCYI